MYVCVWLILIEKNFISKNFQPDDENDHITAAGYIRVFFGFD